MAEISTTTQTAGAGLCTLPGPGCGETQRPPNFLVPVCDLALGCDAPLHPRVVFSGLPRSHVPAAPAHAAGAYRRPGTVDTVPAAPQYRAPAGHHPGCAALHPAHSDPGIGHGAGSCGTGSSVSRGIGLYPLIQGAS